MTVTYARGRKALSTGMSTQAFSADVGGVNPKLAIFWVSWADENDTFRTGASRCRGVTDGVINRCMAEEFESGESTPGSGGKTNSTTRCIFIKDPTDNTNDIEASFNQWGTNEVELTFHQLPQTAIIVDFLLFAGDDLSVLVESFAFSGSQGATLDRTGLGSPADLVFLFANEAPWPTINQSLHQCVTGAWARFGGGRQGVVSTSFGQAIDESTAVVRDDAAYVATRDGDLSDEQVSVSELSTGYRLTADHPDGVNEEFLGIALNFNNTKRAWVGVVPTPTAAAPVTDDVVAQIRAELVLMFTSRANAVNVDDEDDEGSSVYGTGIAAAGESGANQLAVSQHDAVTNTNSASYVDDRILDLPNPDQTFGGAAVRASMSMSLAAGFRLQYSETDTGQAHQQLVVVIGEELVLLPPPVVLNLSAPAPEVDLMRILPAPVVLTLLAPDPAVLGAIVITPAPVVLTLGPTVPFTGFILPAPVVLSLSIADPVVQTPPAPPAPPPDLTAEYLRQFQDLLPVGLLWRRDPDLTLSKLLRGLAALPAEVELRAAALLEEADPRTADELLPEWEALLDIAADCGGLESSTALRRAAITAKLTFLGGQSPQAFVDLAQELGYDVELADIVEVKRMTIGSKIGDKLYTGAWVFVWDVHASIATPFFAIAGEAEAGQPLAEASNTLLECAFNRAKPAHTRVRFFYDKPWTGYAPWDLLLPPPVVLQLSAPNPFQVG